MYGRLLTCNIKPYIPRNQEKYTLYIRLSCAGVIIGALKGEMLVIIVKGYMINILFHWLRVFEPSTDKCKGFILHPQIFVHQCFIYTL